MRDMFTLRCCFLVAWACPLLLVGCKTTEGNVALGVGAVTVLGGQAPSSEIQQIYYLGVFDPQEQVPPTVYRVRVRGQASFISRVQFASGWVQASLVDSLGTHISIDDQKGSIEFTKSDGSEIPSLSTGRRLMVFGPEGFREAPRDHRLVVVMGTSPEAFFEAVDASLGQISEAIAEQRQSGLERLLLDAMRDTRNETKRIEELERDITADLHTNDGEDEE